MVQANGSVPSVPAATISNSRIRASIYLPDAKTGYYRGTRFDWSGVVSSLTWNNHEYFGQWFERYDPATHDAITGPVEEFLTGDAALGYANAAVGGTFIRIGVGVLRKPAEPAFQRFHTYEIVDPGKWTINTETDRIEFIHELSDGAGYAYEYRKTLQLAGETLVLEHELKNTGKKPIVTSVYNHNFFTLDKRTTGPDFVVRFPFAPRATPALKDLAEIRGRDVAFLQEFQPKQTISTQLDGFGSATSDYGFEVENRATSAGVRVTGDRPLNKLLLWSSFRTVCPEPYIDASVEPGRSTSWRTTYAFYEARK
ncbi:MAG TPA: hypothetical protein VJM31_05320 [Vicinamibacterales bacterium]|nr:hypothetical protein [Vicinamibacterales bacterium]